MTIRSKLTLALAGFAGWNGWNWWQRDQSVKSSAMFDELEALKSERGSFMHASAERLALLRRYFVDSSRDALRVACRVGEAFLAVVLLAAAIGAVFLLKTVFGSSEPSA